MACFWANILVARELILQEENCKINSTSLTINDSQRLFMTSDWYDPKNKKSWWTNVNNLYGYGISTVFRKADADTVIET